MKSLHLTIIIMLVIVSSFFISEKANACNYCPLIPLPQQSTTSPITVETNLENYSTGDKIIISGHIANPNNNTPLVIKILDPRNEEQLEKIFPLSLNQSYTWTVSTANFWGFSDSGNYTVLSQYGQDYATTHFYLNSTLVQYLYSQSPLWQFKNGMPAQDVHCHTGLKLIVKAENSEPACVSQITATKLVLQGWALSPPPKEPYVNKISITRLQQSYAVGQSINTTVTYSGYYWYVEPDVKIFDVNGTQVWFNCPFCYARTESIQTPSFGTFAYLVREYSTNALPIINKTGTYTMVASLENKTAEANFTVINTGETGTIQLQNETYDFLVLNATMKGYHNPPLQTMFDGVQFTLLPGPWSGGPPGGCSGTPFRAEAKANDDLYIPLDIFVPDEPCKMNFTTTSLGWQGGLGAGLTISHGNLMILVSRDQNDSRITQMDLKTYGSVCCGMEGDLIKGNLSSSAGPIAGANVTISVNDVLMGHAKTLPDGCFQFNQWNKSKLSNQTNAYLTNEKTSGTFTPFPLVFRVLYQGDNTHFPASAITNSSMYLMAVPIPPPLYETTATPLQVNMTQESSASIRLSVKPITEQWDVAHMNLYLDRLPCGVTYEISQVSDNNTSSITHPAVFDIVLKAATYTPEGSYIVSTMQNRTNPIMANDVGGFTLNILNRSQ